MWIHTQVTHKRTRANRSQAMNCRAEMTAQQPENPLAQGCAGSSAAHTNPKSQLACATKLKWRSVTGHLPRTVLWGSARRTSASLGKNATLWTVRVAGAVALKT